MQLDVTHLTGGLMGNRRTAKPHADPSSTGVDSLAVIQAYSQELAQERHDRIVAQCAQRQLEATVADLQARLADLTEPTEGDARA